MSFGLVWRFKLLPSPDGEETFILARSADRRKKEKAMHDHFLERMEAGLAKLRAAAECGSLKNEAVAHQRLGLLKERYWRAASAFNERIAAIPRPTSKARLSIPWTRNRRWSDWTASYMPSIMRLRSSVMVITSSRKPKAPAAQP